jgi:hypothetical protein
MKKIIIGYWHLHQYPELPYTHLEALEYTEEKRNEILNTILDAGYSVMIRPPNNPDNEVIIWIDKGRFGQK